MTSANVKCDQNGRFIGLWATFQMASMNLPKSPTFLKVSESLIFLLKSF